MTDNAVRTPNANSPLVETLADYGSQPIESDAQKTKLLDANQKFYAALRSCSIRGMDEIWLQTSSVICIHPGWLPLKGWAVIRESWSRIFQNTHMHQITTQVLELDLHDSIGWVVCLEEIGVFHGERRQVGYALSTNIYQLGDDAWKLIHHQGSPIPDPTA